MRTHDRKQEDSHAKTRDKIFKLEEKAVQSWVGDELDKFKHVVKGIWYMQTW